MTGRLLRLLCLGGFLAMLALAPGCAPIRYDHDLVGKVVDSETGKPIPGAVILGSWYKRYSTLAGGHSEFFDVLETVADQQGQFHLEGKGFLLFTNTMPVMATVFKAGYDHDAIDYESLTESGGVVKLRNIAYDKKLMRDRYPPGISGRYEKKKSYIKEEEKLRLMLGMNP